MAERHKEPIQLLLTDLVMPHMSGRELSERMARIHPETKDQPKLRAAELQDGHYLLRSNLVGEDPAVLWEHYVQLDRSKLWYLNPSSMMAFSFTPTNWSTISRTSCLTRCGLA